MSYPLAEVRVLALEHAVSGPLASRHLADLGAEVIKIERPEQGDFARHYDSSVGGLSSYFVWLNRGKRSLTLDIKRRAGREILEQLLDRSDVFITNLAFPALERAGLLPELVRTERPSLIQCTLSGYGRDGPYRDRRAYDLLLQGESGLLSVTGSHDEPAKIGVSVVDISAGVYAAMSILAALLGRHRHGEGASIDISMLETAAEWMSAPLNYYLGSGKQLARAGMRHNLIVPYGPYRCGDNQYLNLAIQSQAEWQRFCELVLQRSDLADDPQFARNQDRLEHREALEPLIEETLLAMTRPELIERMQQAGIAWGDVNDVSELASHPQLQGRDRWITVEVNGKPVNMLAHPMNLAGMPRRTGPVPDLGQHTGEILSELGYDVAAIENLRQAKVI